LGIFSANVKHLLHVPIYAGLQVFIELSQTTTKLCHIERRPPSSHRTFKMSTIGRNGCWHFLTFLPKQLGIFDPNFTHLLHVPIYARSHFLSNCLKL